MILQILGCGTSTGVPIPGCRCGVCISSNPRNQRNRTSAVLKLPNLAHILIDASTDLRHQALKWDLRTVHAVLLTHSHADHVMGIDDLRAFNFTTNSVIPLYGDQRTLADVRRIFSYVFEHDPDYPGGLLPQLTLNQISPGETVSLFDCKIQIFGLPHGQRQVLGFRFDSIGYATDCSDVPTEAIEKLKGVRYLVLDGLRYEPHRTHLSIDQAVAISERVGAEMTYLTHMTHSIEYEEVSAKLPRRVALAYDGLEISA